MSDFLIVVPARAGSVDVPRKSTQIVGGKPLISRTLDMLAEVGDFTAHQLTVVVSTDDPVAAELARQHGVNVHIRSATLAGADVPLHKVVSDVVSSMAWSARVGCAQVTSPYLRAQTVAEMLDVFAGSNFNTASTVVPERDLRWAHATVLGLKPGGSPTADNPSLLGKVVSRQEQGTITERETGGLRLWHTPAAVSTSPVGGAKHLRWTISDTEGIDIDTPEDLHRARDAARRRRLLFVIEASNVTGSGHLHRALTLIDHLSQHHVEVCFVDDAPEWAWDAIESHGVIVAGHKSWADLALTDGAFDCVVFDRLDTNEQEVGFVKAFGAAAVTLEDRGPGSMLCDAVVNELYDGWPLSGPAWSVLRPEFCGPYVPPPGEGRVLVTFGGTDPAGLGQRVQRHLFAGGFVVDAPSPSDRTVPMAARMRAADVVVTSRGRTVTEAMAMGRAVVSIAANVRELDHHHHHGVAYLGPHWLVSDDQIASAVAGLLPVAAEVGAQLRQAVPRDGAERIAGLIDDLAQRRRAVA